MEPIIAAIRDIVGPNGLLLGDDVRQRPALSLGKGSCEAKAIVRPGSTEELARVMQLCHQQRQPVVPWGGLTGLVNGTTAAPEEIAISLERMTAIEAFDIDSGTMTVEAGIPLQAVQDKAEEAGWMFALDLGARGTATIGGNIATNAGGNRVLRYGMMREQVLGLEAVLADGTVVSSMNQMLKNNAGYDLKQLFIGTEGTLGIVTRAVLRLRPLPRSQQTALVALDGFADVAQLLRRLGAELGGQLSAFEVMWNSFYQLMTEETGKHQAVLPSQYPFYVLLEAQGGDPELDSERFEQVLGTALEEGLIADAVIAQSEMQAESLWALRDDIETLVHQLSPLFGFDVSLPISAMAPYVEQVESRLKARWPEARMTVFGHLGDGNLHLVITVGDDSSDTRHQVEDLVYGLLTPVGGSISAEHGIGLEKKGFLHCSRNSAELALMQTLKRALDPLNLLNPHKVLESA